MIPTFPLLLLLWLQDRVSGGPAENVYSKVHRYEGDTLSVQCTYKGRKNQVEDKVWCKIRRKKCEPGFTRLWVSGPRYLLQDDIKAKVVTVTMLALRRQDSGRYWCMRNSSGTLYPLTGFQLEVSPAPTTKRSSPRTHLTKALKSDTVHTRGQPPTSGLGTALTSRGPLLTPGPVTVARLLPSTASGTFRLSSVSSYSFPGPGPSSTGPRRAPESQTETASPQHAGLEPAATHAGHLSTGSPTTGTCHTSISFLDTLPPTRRQDSSPAVLVGALALVPVPLMLIVVYGFWKKRHVGSYSMCHNPTGTWKPLLSRPEPLWKPAWSEAT
ncbi:trem-like transcript 2 protein [Sorex fumeus]|uniref:trem-like transcript 2 protein n=1 Tax=Sorex fumeus TaxID=62283 RepID=UPI0024ADB47B|nr:trem-like transcript 2 protein [Sorex fumeus]